MKVFFDNELGRSWKLDFRKLSTTAVVIWRAAGSWRMDEIEGETCVDFYIKSAGTVCGFHLQEKHFLEIDMTED